MKFGVALAALALLIIGLLALGGRAVSADRSGGAVQPPGSPDTISVFVTFTSDFDSDGDRRDDDDEEGREDEFVEERGGHVRHRYEVTEAVAIDVPIDDFGALMADPRIESVQTDTQVSILDAELDASWGVKHVGSELNHTSGYRGDGVKVGIIDTGINRTHEDLAANYDASCSYDFVNNDTDPMDDNGHGTHVSGIAAAADNGSGVIGMAPDATLCAYKVLGANGGGSYSAILAALDRALADGVDVVNLSLGSGYPGSFVETAFANAHNQGLTIVAAAGNATLCGSAPPVDNEIYPAKFPDVIAVAATDSSNARACFSSVGPDVEIAAPGVSIVAPWIGSNNAFASASGTSMASPHVAGLAAVLLGCGVPMTNDDLAEVLHMTAKDLDSPLLAGVLDGRDTWFGYGLILASNAANAVSCQAAGPAAATPTRTSTSTPTRTNTPIAPTATNTLPPPTATLTNTPIAPTATNTPLPPTATFTNTPSAPAATNTPQPPTATFTNTPGPSAGQMRFSLGSSATLSGTAFQNEDIISWNGTTFTMFFDGSDVMPTSLTIDGFAVMGTSDVLVTFTEAGSLPGAGGFDDSDVLRFQASSLGTTTAGAWSMYFDGSDVGLSSSDEDVDGLEMLPNGQLLLSTTGSFSVTGASGQDEDIIKFTPTMLGQTTSGSWSMYFDGSDVSLSNDEGAEDIDGLAVSGSGSLYLSTTGDLSVPGLSGRDEDVSVFAPTTLGSATAGVWVSLLFFDGSAYGLSSNDVVDIDLP